jgi:hypothetical protein
MGEPVGERNHFANDINGNASVGVGNVGSDIIDVWPGDNTGVNVLHSRCIHVYHYGKEVRSAWTTRGQTGGGPFFSGQGTGKKYRARLAIGGQHRSQ